MLFESLLLRVCPTFVNVQLHKIDPIHGFHNEFVVLVCDFNIDDIFFLIHVFLGIILVTFLGGLFPLIGVL